MKVSGTGIKNFTNLSNEFVGPNLHDEVPYKVALKNLSEANEISENFLTKQRVVRERTSVGGGFRIPQETLKKRVNPSDHLGEDLNQQYIDPTVNSFSFNPLRNKPNTNIKSGQKPIDFSQPLIDEDLPYDMDRDLGSNLIEIIEKQVDQLKRESQEQQKMLEMSRSAKMRNSNNLENQVDEKKVLTEYLSYNPDRVQAIKHVTTQIKPEYMSLEDLQKLKDEHYQKMLKIENEFYEKKKKEQENLERMSKYSDDSRFVKLQQMEMKHNESKKITSEELEAILKHENEYLNRSLANKKVTTQGTLNTVNNTKHKKMMDRARSAKMIKRPGLSQDNINAPLDKNEEKFVKKYMNYVLKKKMTGSGEYYKGFK